MAYQAWSVIAGEQPTASKWNILGTNDAAFNSGTGFAAGSIPSSSLVALLGGQSASVLTQETTTSSSYADLTTTTDTVTITVGTNGLVLVGIYAAITNSGANYTNVSFAVSGANTQAATDTYAISWNSTLFMATGAVFLLTGFAAGSTTFKMKYNAVSGTGTFKNRRIFAIPF